MPAAVMVSLINVNTHSQNVIGTVCAQDEVERECSASQAHTVLHEVNDATL